MATKLYVGNLSYGSTDQSLHTLFSQVGTVSSSQVVIDKFTGQSRGFGFVEMSSEAEAQKAISTFNGQQIDGRTLTVNESRPRENSGGGGGQRSGGGGGGRSRSEGSRW